ncbi:MAG: cytochrome o ubiquinol oxidase subunit IV [bacterium]|nr:cytochrome o ubiquinol oxidase subunit IV [bacterium]
MEHHEQHSENNESHGTIMSYLCGFVFSILLTLAAFTFVYMHVHSEHVFVSHTSLYSMLLVCALVQLIVHLVLFLHLGKGSKSHWNLTALVFAIVVVTILVGGTLWIMSNLKHGAMPASQEPFLNGEITPQTEG